MSLVITKPAGVSFGSEVIVYPPKALNLSQQLVAPSEEEGEVYDHQLQNRTS